MGIYQTICYKVEDLFVKMMTRKEDPVVVKQKVDDYRRRKEDESARKKAEKKAKLEEQQKIQAEKKAERDRLQEEKRAERERLEREREENERKEVMAVLTQVVDVDNLSYTQYEYSEVKKNRQFFISLARQVFERGEKGLTFIYCEYDKSKKVEISGYLIVTNKRVLFLPKDLNFMEKFRYQTIINVSWFNDGLLEKGLQIQYGKRRLVFDEMFNKEQMYRVGNLILQLASNK